MGNSRFLKIGQGFMTKSGPFFRFLARWRPCLQAVITLIMVMLLGHGLAQAMDPPTGSVDPIAPEFQAGHALYVQHCGTCHIALPPALLPRQTWETLITDTAHYGLTLDPLPRFDSQLIWNYLKVYSRPNPDSRIPPFRLRESPYFLALHPQVEFPQPVTLESCISCHPTARAFNFRNWHEPPEPSTDSP
jgi:hypothetical protein